MLKALGEALTQVAEFIDSRNKIWVTLDRYSYVGGDLIQGTVHLNCIVPFFARGVILKVKGYEKAAWEERKVETDNDGTTHTKVHVHSEAKEFFCERIRVYPYEGQVQPGDYKFPFSYQLPATLPGTYRESHGHFGGHAADAYSGEILYFAKAKIDVAFKHDLKSKVHFVVNEKFDQMLQPSYGENSKTFLLTKGKLTARVWLDKNVYFPGNTVIAKLEANNTSVKPTNRLNVYVIRHLHLSAHGHHFNNTREVYKHQYHGFEPSFFGVKWLPFQVPIDLQPSTNGHHVKSQYHFVIECDIPGALDLRVELPTAILAPQWLFSQHPLPPPMAQLPPDVSFRPPWQPDNQAPQCNSCKVNFTLFNRRHHCRNCGKVFCGKCCSQNLSLPNLGYSEPARVCNDCFPNAKETGGHHFQEAAILPTGPSVEPSAPPLEGQQQQ